MFMMMMILMMMRLAPWRWSPL